MGESVAPCLELFYDPRPFFLGVQTARSSSIEAENNIKMSGLRKILSSIIVAAGVAAPQVVCAQPSGDEDARIILYADELTHYRELGHIVASGNVEVIRGEEILRADNLTFNQREDVITASGNVSLLKPSGDIMFASYFELTSDMKDGIARNLRYLLSDNSKAAGAAGRRSAGRNTTLYKAVYSPCKLCEEDPTRPPLWQLKAYQINHDDKLQRIEYKDVFMEIYGVPVFYLPYLSHPDPRKKRESGFLMPSYGTDSDLGGFLQTPYYFNIAPDRDFTFEPVWFVGGQQALLAGEYRQRMATGEMKVYASMTRESDENNSDGMPRNRGHISGDGRFDIDDTWRWGFEIERSTDDTYLRRYGFHSPQTLTSNAFAEGFRERNYARVDVYSFQDLRGVSGFTTPPGFATSMDFNHVGEPGTLGSYWSLDGNAMTLNRNGGTSSNRLSAKGGWHLPYTTRMGEIYELSATLQGDGYYVGDQKNVSGSKEYTGFTGRVFPQMSLQWRLPLVRTEGSSSDIIEPIAALTIAPNTGNQWKIPNEDSLDFEFDDSNLLSPNRYTGIDRIEGGQRIDYGLKWTGNYSREGKSGFFIGQSFRFREDHKFVEGSGLEDHLSDFVGRVSVDPSEFLKIDHRFRVDKDNLSLRRSESRLAVGPQWLRLGIGHIFIDGETGTGGFGDREEIRGSISTIPYENWKAFLTSTKRLSSPSGMVSSGLNVSYEDECFKFIASFVRQHFEDRDLKPNDILTLRLVFKNVGQLTSPRFNLNRGGGDSDEGIFDRLKGWRVEG